MTREIPLTKGFVALVDDEDYDRVMAAGSWRTLSGRCGLMYARRHVRVDGRRVVDEVLHRFLTGWPLVDHINGDGLDNRRANLRPATTSQNLANRRIQCNNRSGFKGVGWHTSTGKWRSRIVVDGKRFNLGAFTTPEAAALAYDAAARELHGEFACVNFPRPGERGAA